MREVMTQLESLRRRSRGLLVLQRLAVLISWTAGSAFALILFDYALRLPSTFRFITLIAGLGVLAYVLGTYLLSALRFAPSLTQLALRVERSLPGVAGRLASSVEFAAAGLDQQNVLAARSVRDAQGRLIGESMRTVIRPKQTLRDLAIMGVVVLIIVGAALSNPAAAQTGLTRLLLPYGGTKWPARTGVDSLMSEVLTASQVYPRGQALPLRARVTRGELGQRVTARFRLRVDEQWQDWQQVVLTRQGATDVHERLVDTNAEAIELYFQTSDDATETERIAIVPPPAIVRAMLSATPPAYASGRVPAVEAELGPGTDDRAITESALLAGSRAELVLELNKPIPVPETGAPRDEWLRETLGWTGETLPALQIDEDLPGRWRLRWILRETRTMALDLEDEHGLRNAETIAYRIEVVVDAPPSVTITSPQSDQAVLPSAVVDVVAEAKDDVAVSQLSLEAAHQPTERSTPEDDSAVWSRETSADSPAASMAEALDLSKLTLGEGDVIALRAVARDAFELDGATHDAAVSPARRLRIISELEFATQLRRQLSVVRQNAIRMESMQAELQDAVRDEGPRPGMERSQAQIGERIAAQRESIDEIEQQMRDNRLQDEQLENLLQQSRDLLDFAGRAANRAVEQLAGAGEQPPGQPNGERTPEQRAAEERALESQQEVRDELADLIELLDRDEDTWVVTRQLEGLLDEQQQLEQSTGGLAERTIGEEIENLSRDDRTELDRIAQQQTELRDQARQLLESLRQRAEAMQEVDPQTASGMRNAANTGEQRELDREMENAAEQARQNQLRGAQARQQAASSTLQRMLEDMQENQRARAEQLLRQLASLIESIDRLIVVQENEMSALAAAIAEEDFAGRDRAMIRLNQNTQAVAAEARAAGQEARRIARTLDRAAESQGAAVTALRAAPLDAPAVEEAEARSLELLQEAKALAEELEQQTREDEVRQRREELVESYRKLAERQVALREQTLELAGREELDRRGLVEARRLGNQQDDLRVAIDDLEAETHEVVESLVFSHVHQQIGRWSVGASDELWAGRANRRATDLQERIAGAIGRLIDALEDPPAPPDDFEDGQSQGGSGGGAQPQPLIPPLAELRLIRGMQEEVYNYTRELDAREDLNDAQRRERMRDLGQQQRDLLELGRQMLEQLQRQ